MATRNNRAVLKLEPVPLTLTFATAPGAPGAVVTSFIDLSQSVSIAARKFLRQGLNWGFAGIKCMSLDAGSVAIYKLPNSWVMSNAWHKSYASWQRMNNEALEENQSIRPRFLDFKIYADAEHHGLGYAANLLPVNGVAPTTAGEWEPSKIIITADGNPNLGSSLELIAVGANYPGASAATGLDAVSLIEGYAASRGLPNVLDPNVPFDAADAAGTTPENWMTAMFNEGTVQDSVVLDDMITENNISPYPFENDGTALDTMYPGGANQMSGLEWHDIGHIYQTSATTNIGFTRIKGGNFPCGLIKVRWHPTEGNANLVLQIDLIPGFERGYLAEPMQDM